jgi:hypothetical protein
MNETTITEFEALEELELYVRGIVEDGLPSDKYMREMFNL